ncbi:MAG: spore maturation protein [Oscillospiraceae bacterium]|nr:spore maturation protein [Oscillospiraceae bacterium]
MSMLGQLAAPLLIAAICLAALPRGTDVYDAMLAGAKKGLRTMADILPALLVLLPAIALFRASGLPTLLGRLLDPLLQRLGIPGETALLLLLRPLSGSAALSEVSALMAAYGADSLVGRTAAVMLGASETTFYVVAVYFSAAGVERSRWAVPAALCADLACFVSAAWVSRWLWG